MPLNPNVATRENSPLEMAAINDKAVLKGGPTKLLFYIFSLGQGGAERVTANLANYWAAKGWEITIVTLAPTANDYYALEPAIRRRVIGLARPSRDLVEGFWQNIKRVRALRQVLLDVRPDIAVAMMSSACVTLAAAAWGLSGVMAMGSIRSHPAIRPTKPVWKRVESIGLGQLKAIVAQTQTTAAWLARNTASRRIEVIPNPINWPLPEGEPSLDPDATCPRDRKVLLAAGRLVPEKGYRLLIQAYVSIAGNHPDWDLAIIGEGPERVDLQSHISASRMGARIFMPGWAGNTAEWYKRADLYAMTSRFEGFPNTLAEAMAHGLPAVSFDCDAGPRDIICNGEDGLLAPPEDVPALAEALDRLMSDDHLRRRFGVAAREKRNRFSIGTVAAMWEALFAELLNREPGSKGLRRD